MTPTPKQIRDKRNKFESRRLELIKTLFKQSIIPSLHKYINAPKIPMELGKIYFRYKDYAPKCIDNDDWNIIHDDEDFFKQTIIGLFKSIGWEAEITSCLELVFETRLWLELTPMEIVEPIKPVKNKRRSFWQWCYDFLEIAKI